MQIEVKIDAGCPGTKVIIVTGEMTEEINLLVRKISEHRPSVIAGFQDGEVTILDLDKVYRFYSSGQKVYAASENGEYTVRLRLYELEQRVSPSEFVRISNSEIINLKRAEGFDLSFSGTICVKLRDGSTSYVSRRYVTKIKQVLGI